MRTRNLSARIFKSLSNLIDLPMWKANRAMNMEMFQFGERHKCLNRKGKIVESGDYALHIQCPWRIVGTNGIIVGSLDRRHTKDEGFVRDDDSDGPTLCELRMNSWLSRYSRKPLLVERVEADSVGGFRLILQRGHILEAFPSDSCRGEYSEHWRLFQPWKKRRHFVVTGHGVE